LIFMRLAAVFIALAAIILIPFLIWGDWFDEAFTGDALQQWLAARGYAWGWLPAVLLLAADLFLPVPGTAVMSGLGYVYGAFAGGLIAAGGSFAGGMLAWWLCRQCGERMAVRLMGEKGYEQGRRLFGGDTGAFVVAISRCLPLLPEIVACMAGLTKMPAARFLTALACGSLPMGFIFAWIGAAGRESPGLAIGLSALIPAVLYGLALAAMRFRSSTRARSEWPDV
jgi:uncharacterized membrane protein YdjX (TVP38/TMEM64 family)